MNELGSKVSVWRLMEIILVEARSSVEWVGIDGILWFLKYTCTHETKYTYVIHIYVFSCVYTFLLTAERAQFYTLGSKNRFLYPYFNYFSFIYLLYKCVGTRFLLCVWKWRMICGCHVPPSILLVLRIKLLSSDLAENDFNLWAVYLFSYLRFEFQISPPPQKKRIMSFQSCLNATEWKCLDSKVLGRVIRNWI